MTHCSRYYNTHVCACPTELPARRAAARVLPRRRQGQETHPRQPEVARRSRGSASCIALPRRRLRTATPPPCSASRQLLDRDRALATAMILARILGDRPLPVPRTLTQGRRRRRHGLARPPPGGPAEEGALVLCDVTSVYFEGSKCPKQRQARQAPDRLRWNREGCPVAAEVFERSSARWPPSWRRKRFPCRASSWSATGGCCRHLPQAGQGRHLAALPLRPGSGRDARVVPGGAPGGVQPAAGRRAGPQAAGPARRHRTRAGQGRGRPGASSGPCGARTRSPCAPTGRCAASRSASTSTPQHRTASRMCATRTASP